LGTLVRHAVLDAVAARHAAYLALRSELEVSLPEGALLEDWLRQAGYEAGLAAEKIGSTNVALHTLATSWAAYPEASENSLFHPEMKDVGLAARPRSLQGASGSDETVLVVVVGVERNVLLRRRFTGLDEREEIRLEFVEAVNAARAAVGNRPIFGDARLDRAADRFASQLAREEGGVTLEGFELPAAPRGKRRSRRPPDLVDLAATEGYRARMVQANELRGTVTAEQVVDTWLRSAEHQRHILSEVIRDVGTGFWLGTLDGELQVLWVQIYARPGV
jgi:uncharacterized protein YkwD